MPTESRAVDIVLLGATGFTGGLIAEYLAANAPSAVTMAVAGRHHQSADPVAHQFGHRGAQRCRSGDRGDHVALGLQDRGDEHVPSPSGPSVSHRPWYG